MRRRAVVTALAAVALLSAGCNEKAVPSGPPEPARAPRPPADELDRALAAPDLLGAALRSWRDDCRAVA